MADKHLTEEKFTDFMLAPALLKGLADAGFEYCTPIQARSLPLALHGKDIAGQAQTGTGKTVAFLLACCQHMLNKDQQSEQNKRQLRAIILAPTRELAIQIHRDAQVLAAHTGFTLGLVYGGTGYETQKVMLSQGVDILIGTPGRLIDYFKQKLFDLETIQVLVLDEADRMFDLGFLKDIRYLLRRMPSPEQRLNLLYSATLSYRVTELAYEHMNDPQTIKIHTDSKVVDRIKEHAYYPADNEKLPLLVNLLKIEDQKRILIFVNTKHMAEKITRCLSANNIQNGMLSGDVPQQKRERLLQQFKLGTIFILVATDVAARGLHIPEVSHVYNFDLPQDPEDYIHRIGRTARAGADGDAISFVCERYAYSIMDIEEYIGHEIPRCAIETKHLTEIILPAPEKRWPQKRGKEKATQGNHKPSRITAKTNDDQTDSPSPQQNIEKEVIIKPSVVLDDKLALRELKPNRFSRRFGEVPCIG